MTDGELRKIGRKQARACGHGLPRFTVAPATRNHGRLYYAWCTCGAALVCEEGCWPRGTALKPHRTLGAP